MRKIIIIALPSFLLLTGTMAFKMAAVYSHPASKATAERSIAFKKIFSFGCGGTLDYDDITGDIPPLPGWGNYSWKIATSSDSAQFYFNQGINMYYGFHMIESVASFQKASRFDSTCAMIWYGRALSLGPTINDDATAPAPLNAWECATKSKTLSANCTPFEKDLIDAIQQRYSEDTAANVALLKQHYADAMKLVSDKYNGNADAQALYADALMLMHPWDLYDNHQQPRPWTTLIAKILLQALANNPRHPGANHYYIHTLEGSEHPEKALLAATTLGELMPGVSHVTHMPSHIYIRTGDYAKGIMVNDSAVNAYDNYVSLYPPVTDGIGLYKLHNVHLKATCAQMAGNFEIAMKAAQELRNSISADYLSIPGSFGNFIQYAYETNVFNEVRFGKWDDLVKLPVNDSLAFASQIQRFARCMAFSRKHRFTEAENELQSFKKGMQNPGLKISNGPFTTPFGVCLVAQGILEGVLAQEQGQYPQAITALNQAVMAEDNVVYNKPRDWPLSARQYLGNVLLQTKAYELAAEVFNKELVINPKNGWSLTGLLFAYKGMGNKAAAQKVAIRLKAAFGIKDTDIQAPVF